jgi:hypothetical protein
VAAGTRYAIVASSSEQASEYAWSGSPNPGAYAGGDPFGTADIPPSGGWFASTALGGDYAFKTYVVSDTTPPETMIGSKKIKSTKATFTFISSEPGSTFQCKLDKHSFKPCSSPKKYKHLSSGKHKFEVRAVDKAGNIDASPAKKKFTI